MFARNRPRLARNRKNTVDHTHPEIDPMLCVLRQISAVARTQQGWPNFDQLWAEVKQVWAGVDQHRQKMVRDQPQNGPESPRSDPMSVTATMWLILVGKLDVLGQSGKSCRTMKTSPRQRRIWATTRNSLNTCLATWGQICGNVEARRDDQVFFPRRVPSNGPAIRW